MISIKYTLTQGMDGAGTHTECEMTTGPRNLIKVAEAFDSVRDRLKAAYGNVGCGRVWVEIDGVEVSESELKKVTRQDYDIDLRDYKDGVRSSKPDSLTIRANELIADAREAA